MANKYIRHGETYCGDGTTSAAATSNGGVGALNSLIYFEGTTWPAPAVLAAGDVVYIRSKDQAGADITRTLTAAISLGGASATEAAPCTWVIDDGVIWAGMNGQLKYSSAVATYNITVLKNNLVISLATERLIFESTNTALSYGQYVLNNQGTIVGALIDNSAKTSNGDSNLVRYGSMAVFDRSHFKMGRISYGGYPQFSHVDPGYTGSGYIKALFTNCDFDMTYSPSNNGGVLFSTDLSYNGEILIVGGQIRGVGSVAGDYLVSSGVSYNAASIRFVGTKIPSAPMMLINRNTSPVYDHNIEIVGADSYGKIGGHFENYLGFATSRTDNNPPARNAWLPDSTSTPWAWRIWPRRASKSRPWRQLFAKTFTGVSSTLTVELEVLTSTDASPDKSSVWIELSYTDTAGVAQFASSRTLDPSGLDASAVGDWSATVWGAISFNKNKITVPTPTAVKQDSLLVVALMMSCGNVNANAVYFVDPDFTVTQ